ncbi:MAG: threonine/serine exporter family protein [Enhygromyxa sp.]
MRTSSSLSFLATAAALLHRHGMPAHRLEDTLVACAAGLGVEVQVLATPTSVELAFGGRRQRRHLIRSDAGEAELGRLVALDRTIASVRAGELDPIAGRRELLRIARARPPFGAAAIVIAYGIASAAAASFFAGALIDVLASLGLGLSLGLFAIAASERASLARLFAPIAAFAIASLSLLAERGLGVQAHVTTLAGLIVLIPGLSLTVAMTELATRHLVSGTARLAGAMTVFVTMAFGVAVARTIASALPMVASVELPALALAPLPGWTRGLALVLAPLGFCVLFQARRADVPAIAIAGIASAELARIVGGIGGPELGAFAGASALALAADGYAAWRRLPAAVVLLPGLLLLVPGSIGFQSVTLFLAHDPLAGIEAAFRMVLVAVALVAGCLVVRSRSGGAVPARRAAWPPPPRVEHARKARQSVGSRGHDPRGFDT